MTGLYKTLFVGASKKWVDRRFFFWHGRDMREGLALAVAKAGGQNALGRALNIGQTTISYWCRKGKIPAEHVLKVEELTGVSRHDLRPDIYPEEIREPGA